MKIYEQTLFKKMIGRILEIAPGRIFLEAGLPAEYKVGEWMRQQYQVLDKETDTRYRVILRIEFFEIVEADQLINTMTLPELMALVEQQNG